MSTTVALIIIVCLLVAIGWSRSLVEKTKPEVVLHRRVWRYV